MTNYFDFKLNFVLSKLRALIHTDLARTIHSNFVGMKNTKFERHLAVKKESTCKNNGKKKWNRDKKM